MRCCMAAARTLCVATLHFSAAYQHCRYLSFAICCVVTWTHHLRLPQEIFRRQLKKLLAVIGDRVDLVDLRGGLLSKEVRFDERGVKSMALLHKIFGAHQVLREHAVTKYDESCAAEYPPHGTFLYDRLEEGLSDLEVQLQQYGSVDALLGFSQARRRSFICWHQPAALAGIHGSVLFGPMR